MNRKKSRFFQRLAAGAIALCTVLSAAGCGSSEGNGKIAVIAKGSGTDYWTNCEQGAIDAGKELRYEVNFVTPSSEADVEGQVGMINQAISDNVKAIVIAPINSSEVSEALSAADEKGIPVVCISNEPEGSFTARRICIATDHDSGGAIAAREAYNVGYNKGHIKILSGEEPNSPGDARFAGFKKEILYNPEKFKNMTLLEDDITYCGNNEDVAYEAAKYVIEHDSELSVIFATNEYATLGACRAVEELKMSSRISVLGYDSSKALTQYLMDRVLDGMIVQNPYNMGYLGIRYAHQVINDNEVPDKLDTGAIYVNSNNYSKDEIQLLIDPVHFAENQASEEEEG